MYESFNEIRMLYVHQYFDKYAENKVISSNLDFLVTVQLKGSHFQICIALSRPAYLFSNNKKSLLLPLLTKTDSFIVAFVDNAKMKSEISQSEIMTETEMA